MRKKYKFKKLTQEGAFTLIELLVVISIIGLLMGILLPGLSSARSMAKEVMCRSNVRQLLIACKGYSMENDGYFVPAAEDMWDNSGLHRWHGSRLNLNEPFEPNGSPLFGYLGQGRIKECPACVDFLKNKNWDENFERGCGGYGYNMTYIGSRLWDNNINKMGIVGAAYSHTTNICEIKTPAETLIFADTAISKDGNNLIEYSFAEQPFALVAGEQLEGFYMSASMHFRHRNCASVGWADDHVSMEQIADMDQLNAYGIKNSDLKLGWFEPLDNTPFDLK